MVHTGLGEKRHLTDEDITQLRALEAACVQADGIRVKFNWEMIHDRDTAHIQGFCWHEEDRIVGYAPLDGFGSEFELTGAVLPAYRRQGIFRRLFEAAQAEVRQRGSQHLLLVSYPGCPAGTAATRRLGASYRFSEYQMEAEAAAVPPLPHSALRLEEVTSDDVSELSQTMGLSIDERRNAPDVLHRALQTPGQRFFLARVGTAAVGQIGTVISPKGDVYLRTVGILPERRRQGFGRQMLAAAVHQLIVEGHTRFTLDVETDNIQALSLYQSCGFRETMAYDYSLVE